MFLIIVKRINLDQHYEDSTKSKIDRFSFFEFVVVNVLADVMKKNNIEY